MINMCGLQGESLNGTVCSSALWTLANASVAILIANPSSCSNILVTVNSSSNSYTKRIVAKSYDLIIIS